MGLTSRLAAASLSGALKCALLYVRMFSLSSLNLSLNLIHLSILKATAKLCMHCALWGRGVLPRSCSEYAGIQAHVGPSVMTPPSRFESFWISFSTGLLLCYVGKDT